MRDKSVSNKISFEYNIMDSNYVKKKKRGYSHAPLEIVINKDHIVIT